MSAHDPPPPSAAASARTGTAKLAELIEKAAAGLGAGPRLRFQRGHDMSGITTFELGDDGAYTLSRTSRRGGPPAAFAGSLDAAQRQALFASAARGAIVTLTSSTRPIGDDEQPITVQLDGAGQRFVLTLWAEDAADNAGFGAFTSALYPLLDQLSGGAIPLQP